MFVCVHGRRRKFQTRSFVSIPYSFKSIFKYLDDKHLCEEYSFISNDDGALQNLTNMKKKVKIIEKSKTNNSSMPLP